MTPPTEVPPHSREEYQLQLELGGLRVRSWVVNRLCLLFIFYIYIIAQTLRKVNYYVGLDI